MPRFREEPISPLLGTTLMEVLRDDLHHGVVDLALDELHRWLVDNPETFTRGAGGAGAVVGAAEAQRRRHPRASTCRPSRWLEDIRDDPHHRAREALDSMLGQLAHDLLNDAATQEPGRGASRSGCSTTRRS